MQSQKKIQSQRKSQRRNQKRAKRRKKRNCKNYKRRRQRRKRCAQVRWENFFEAKDSSGSRLPMMCLEAGSKQGMLSESKPKVPGCVRSERCGKELPLKNLSCWTFNGQTEKSTSTVTGARNSSLSDKN